jgi:hypothetical protein
MTQTCKLVENNYSRGMAKKAVAKETVVVPRSKPSVLLDTRVIYCGDNLEQLAKLPDASVDLIFFREEHRIIIPLTVQEILDEGIARKLA